MRTSRFIPLLVSSLVLVWSLNPVYAQQSEQQEKKSFKADEGSATIDVSKYPKEIQEYYPVFAKRCSKCHTLARPINSSFALPNEWERYIKRMMRKPGSGINAEDGKKIFEFLKYDSQTRKKALYEKRLKEQTGTGAGEKGV